MKVYMILFPFLEGCKLNNPENIYLFAEKLLLYAFLIDLAQCFPIKTHIAIWLN